MEATDRSVRSRIAGASLSAGLYAAGRVSPKCALGGRRYRVLGFGARWLPMPREAVLVVGGVNLVFDTSATLERTTAVALHSMLRSARDSPLGRFLASSELGNRTFVDIGANVGVYSLLAASLGASNTVLFEPDPSHFRFLSRNYEAFDRVYDVALSNRVGTAYFRRSDRSNPGSASLRGEPKTSDVTVRTAPFDALVGDLSKMPPVALIKVDVEGAEEEVIGGAQDALAQLGLPPVWCEVRGSASSRAPDSWREVTAMLERLGYLGSIVETDGALTPIGQEEFNGRVVVDCVYVAHGTTIPDLTAD